MHILRSIVMLTIMFFVSIAQAQEQPLRIIEPADASEVGPRPVIKGSVVDPAANVVLVVHPLEVNEYWVQPEVNVRESGHWAVSVHIGRPTMDCGKDFEVMAIGNPQGDLSEGSVLSDFPEGQWKSPAILLTRTQGC